MLDGVNGARVSTEFSLMQVLLMLLYLCGRGKDMPIYKMAISDEEDLIVWGFFLLGVEDGST